MLLGADSVVRLADLEPAAIARSRVCSYTSLVLGSFRTRDNELTGPVT